MDPKAKAVVGLSIALTITSLAYSAVWAVSAKRQALEVASAAFLFLGALMVIRELFVRTRGDGDEKDRTRYLMTAVIWLSAGFSLMWWRHWNPSHHKFCSNLGVGLLAFGIPGLIVQGIYEKFPHAGRAIENEWVRLGLGVLLLLVGFLVQLRLVLDPLLR